MATTYIAFLRAINVGGHIVKMDRLRELFSDLGFGNVRSYIQSGNIFFHTERTDRAALTQEIEEHLSGALGYKVGVMLRTIPEVESVIELDPFKDVEVTPDVRLYVIFLAEPVPIPDGLLLRSPKGDCDVVAVTGNENFCGSSAGERAARRSDGVSGEDVWQGGGDDPLLPYNGEDIARRERRVKWANEP
jgi:uncharacterized protein (DUF1697 family)